MSYPMFFNKTCPYLCGMNYEACLEYLYSKLPMFSRTGAAALKLDLSNTLAICDFLGNPQQHFPTIHIAGTNGKGSVSHMMASVLQEAGYKTGLYTSPHLYDFRERIKVNGQMIPQEDVIHFTEHIQPLIESIEPSFFEVTVGMAFEFFFREKVDVAIIETGLGGRLDSTNIIQPVLSVITNIGLDHVQLLGDSLGKIAKEKAGIIKKETPVVIGRTHPETKQIFQRTADELNAPIFFADQEYESKFINFNEGISRFEIKSLADYRWIEVQSTLAGSYQAENIATVFSAIHKLQEIKFTITQENLYAGIQYAKINTGLYGRWDMIQKHPYVFLDVGHNEDGIRKILEQISLFPHQRLWIILGMSKDKEIEATLKLLPKYGTYYFTQAHLPRALEAEELALMAQTIGLNGKTMHHVNEALDDVLKLSNHDDLIVVCGSIFVVAEVDRNKFN